MKKKIILIGAGGHAKSCIDIINAEGKYEIIGLVDNKKKKGSKIFNYKVLGDDKILKISEVKYNLLLAVGQIKTHELKKII